MIVDRALRWLRYIGRGGALIELRHEGYRRGQRWFWWFAGSRVEAGPYRSKLEALCAASWACGRPAAEMDWQPLDRIEARHAA